MRNENINLKQNSQSCQTSVSGCFGARNVKIYKIIKIFCFLIWWLRNVLYICTQITTTKLLSLKNRNYENYKRNIKTSI